MAIFRPTTQIVRDVRQRLLQPQPDFTGAHGILQASAKTHVVEIPIHIAAGLLAILRDGSRIPGLALFVDSFESAPYAIFARETGPHLTLERDPFAGEGESSEGGWVPAPSHIHIMELRDDRVVSRRFLKVEAITGKMSETQTDRVTQCRGVLEAGASEFSGVRVTGFSGSSSDYRTIYHSSVADDDMPWVAAARELGIHYLLGRTKRV